MTKLSLTVLILAYLLSCKSPDKPTIKTVSKQNTTKEDTSLKKLHATSSKKLGFYTLIGDTVVVPPFEIDVLLSPKAKDRIVNSSETIIIDVFLEGIPKNPEKVHLEEDGSLYLSSAKKEILYGQVARFDNLKFPRKKYNQLLDKDAFLTVNIYTGRKSSEYNLLSGDFLSDKVSYVINKRFTLNQKLISGDD